MKKKHSVLKRKLSSFIKKYIHQLTFLLLMIQIGFDCYGQTTYTWNQTGIASWAVSTNWTPIRTSSTSTDILIFNNGASTTVTNIPTETIGQLLISNATIVNLQGAVPLTLLTINGLAGVDLSVASNSQLNINDAINNITIALATGATGSITGNMTFSGAPHRLDPSDANAIIFNSPAIFTQGAGCTGFVFTNTLPANAIIFSSGTTFVQSDGANPFGLAQPASKVVFNSGSLYVFQEPSTTPSLSGRTYANFQFKGSGSASNCFGGGAFSIDNFNVTSGTINVNMTGTSGHSIKGNVTVAPGATLNFTPASAGTINFNGATAQSITNSGTLTFGGNENVTINNSAGVIINGNITINGQATFTSGIVSIPNLYKLTLSSTSSVTGVSNSSFVDGKVEKFGNTDFIFPVGKTSINGYVPIKISNFASYPATTTAFTAEYIRASAVALGNVTYPGLHHVSSVDYWTLNNTGSTNPIADITCYWTNESSNGGSSNYINSLTDLIIAHFDGSSWNLTSLVPVITGGSNFISGSITWPAVSVFSPFSLGSSNITNPLPVSINYLKGLKYKDGLNIEFKVNCSNNTNSTLSLQRSSDNINYININTIVINDLNCLKTFNYLDKNPIYGLNYYRLKINAANSNSTSTYSAPIMLLNNTTGFNFVGLYPLVVNNTALLSVLSVQKIKMELVITDVLCKPVQKMAYNLIEGDNKINLDLSNLAIGIYQITGYTFDGKLSTIRFLKQ